MQHRVQHTHCVKVHIVNTCMTCIPAFAASSANTHKHVVCLQHNTCPVCRKELPVDEELRNQQQQSRQQRFQQEVQRQPAGLQSLFGALNPFHLLGRNRNNTDAASAGAQNGGSNNASDAQNNSNVSAAGLPSATAERLDSVRASLQELEVCASPSLCMHLCIAFTYCHVLCCAVQFSR